MKHETSVYVSAYLLMVNHNMNMFLNVGCTQKHFGKPLLRALSVFFVVDSRTNFPSCRQTVAVDAGRDHKVKNLSDLMLVSSMWSYRNALTIRMLKYQNFLIL